MSVQLSVGYETWKAIGGRYRVRIRETHVRDHLGPLITSGAAGTAKLDLVLRGIAALPDGVHGPGEIDPAVSWVDLHDLLRPPTFYRDVPTLKRKWVSDKLLKLERLGLLGRRAVPGSRPQLVVLRDDGSGRSFDDPAGSGADSYVTTLGSVIAFGRLTSWGGPEVAAYLAALTAERYARSDADMVRRFALDERPFGGGVWYRPLRWFSETEGNRPTNQVRFPFAERTLRRGFANLKREGLVATERIHLDPRTGRPFAVGPRLLYQNGFDDVRPGRRLRSVPGTADRLTAHRARQ